VTTAAELSAWVTLSTAFLVLLGASLALIGSVGLLRLESFYARVHAPTLGATLGVGCVLIASMLFFSVLQTRPIVHEILIAVFVTMTTPITLMLLVRAALLRDRSEEQDPTGRMASDGTTTKPPASGTIDAG